MSLELKNMRHVSIVVKCPVCGKWSPARYLDRQGFNAEPVIRVNYVTGLGYGRGFKNITIPEVSDHMGLYEKIRTWFKERFKIYSKEDQTWLEKLSKTRTGLNMLPETEISVISTHNLHQNSRNGLKMTSLARLR